MLNEWHRRWITRFVDLPCYWVVLILRAVAVIDRKGVPFFCWLIYFALVMGSFKLATKSPSFELRIKGRDSLLAFALIYFFGKMLVCKKYFKTAMYQLHHLKVPSGSNWIYQTPVCDCSNNPCCYWGHRHLVPEQSVWVSRCSRLKGVTDNLHTIPWDTHLVTT